MAGTRSRSIRVVLAATLALVAAIGASTVMTLAQAEPSASPEIHGWPGARSEPAGLYSWTIGDHERWMHKGSGVIGTGPSSVEIAFVMMESAPPAASVAVAGADLSGPYSATPERAADERLQTWRLDVDGAKVAIILRSFPDTPPTLVAEAEAVVESITVQPTEDGDGQRLVFRLGEGWDSG